MELFSATAIPFWTAIAALAAVGTAFVTSVYTYLTLRLFRTQAEPKVIIYVRQNINSPFILQLVVENIGKDIAFDVRFETSRQLPENAYGLDKNTLREFKAMQDGPIIEGIPALEPNGIRIIDWGQYGGLTKALNGESADVKITYRHEKRILHGYGTLNIRSFCTVSANKPPLVKIADELASMKKDIQRISERLHPLEVAKFKQTEENETIDG